MDQNIERTAVYIDGDETYQILKALRMEMDFKSLRALFAQSSRLMRVSYYAIVPEDDVYCTQMPLLDWLEYNGFTVVKKRWQASSNRRKPPNLSIEIAVDALTTFQNIDHVVLMSGDHNLVTTVRVLKSRGIRVTVIWTLNQDTAPVSDALRREADDFIEVFSMKGVCTPKPESKAGFATERA